MDLDLTGRVVLVTGGSRGLGRATVDVLVAEGAHVVVSGRDPGALAAVVDAHGPEAVEAVAGDNADPGAPERLLAAARRRWGRLDAALVSVGGPPPGPVSAAPGRPAVTDGQWADAFASVFLGAVRIGREVGGALPAGGSLAFVLSTSVKAPVPGLAISNGLRPGLAMVAKTLADELGPRGVRVNTLLPGRVATDRVAELDDATGDPDAARRAAVRAIPLGRYGEPAEFGRVAAFLLSPAASFVSGAAVPVDGGALRAL